MWGCKVKKLFHAEHYVEVGCRICDCATCPGIVCVDTDNAGACVVYDRCPPSDVEGVSGMAFIYIG